MTDTVLKKNIQTNIVNADQPIGIFDSGVGGLSIAKCISETLPNEQLIYVADSAFAPYGDIEICLIEQRVDAIANWLVSQSVKAIVVACNTATVNAIEKLRTQYHLPIIGVEPAIKPAAKQSKTKKVAILVTQATAQNKRFLALVEKHKNNSEVIVQPCPGLVELVEAGKTNSIECQQLLQGYLIPLVEQGIDTLVLGCTHYPFLHQQITNIVGATITIMETAKPVTQQLKRRLSHYNLLNTSQSPNQINLIEHQFYSSKNCFNQQATFSQLWQQEISLTILDKKMR
jgi:glutamate racemase